MIKLPKNKQLILFDGICNFCNSAVLRIVKLDKKNNFVFASLQSSIGQNIISNLGIDTNKTDSIILYKHDLLYYTKSTAILQIIKAFGGFWKLTVVFYIIPKFFRDYLYGLVAKNRYKWFGIKDKCMIPTPELRKKFL
ncbi:MAG: thiol-disulfide oxidoreductase DCC family protein [Tenacibaculum sp.]